MLFFDRNQFLSELEFCSDILNSDSKDDFFAKIMALYLWKKASRYSTYRDTNFDKTITHAVKSCKLQEFFGSEFLLKHKGVVFQNSSVLESVIVENKKEFQKFFIETILKGE